MKPDRDTLNKLYSIDKLSTRAIGEMYGVAHISVRRWLTSYDIPARATGRGLDNRGVTPPTADELRRMLHEDFRSYDHIAAQYGVTRSAVMHWLMNHGIEQSSDTWYTRRQRTIEEPSADALRLLYDEGLSIQAIGDQLGYSYTIVEKWFTAAGIERRSAGWDGGKRHACDDGHLVRSTYELRVDNWLTEHGISHVYEPALPFDRRYHADFFANGWYIEIWGVLGSPKYIARTAKKKLMYKAHACPLIEVPAHAFATLHRGLWKRKLNRLLQPALQVFELA